VTAPLRSLDAADQTLPELLERQAGGFGRAGAGRCLPDGLRVIAQVRASAPRDTEVRLFEHDGALSARPTADENS
jgi:hypothetical protein